MQIFGFFLMKMSSEGEVDLAVSLTVYRIPHK
jgi:hypothetical protein